MDSFANADCICARPQKLGTGANEGAGGPRCIPVASLCRATCVLGASPFWASNCLCFTACNNTNIPFKDLLCNSMRVPCKETGTTIHVDLHAICSPGTRICFAPRTYRLLIMLMLIFNDTGRHNSVRDYTEKNRIPVNGRRIRRLGACGKQPDSKQEKFCFFTSPAHVGS